MVKILVNLQKTLKTVAFQQLASIQQVQSFSELEKEMKDNIVYTQQDSTTYVVGTNIDRPVL